ncbi:DNA/RNA helicase domain-containing protein [Leptospira sp. GIMC2001]|uniref:DNA/RNA helicase domain-containing protein n=1 Tax=Leptospira sp. GIMC2001 TaxID=1513297 RepID=UPI002349AAE7|nr:DNA/RNA helicase domain-containing protein [Leptospira sp. GIMC2001]WCL50747.1 DUF2075 domain-containing protein [Leptospira sp. GIMC2001]
MLIYKSNINGFLKDIDSNQIDGIIRDSYIARVGWGVSGSELRSWKNSLEAFSRVIGFRECRLPDSTGVAIEYHIPSTSKRVDVLLSGYNKSQNSTVAIVELKQWESAEKSELDGLVKTYLGGGLRLTSHPSYQAWSYSTLLESFNENVYTQNIQLNPCAYLHNYFQNDEAILNPIYNEYLEKAPVFLQQDGRKLREFLESKIEKGDEGKTIEIIEKSPIRPSKQLAESVLSLLEGNPEFIMIDEQKIVFEKAKQMALQKKQNTRRVFVIEGGPGTGKSVVAINLLARLTSKSQNVRYVSKNAAPRAVYSNKLRSGGKTISATSLLFSGSGSFIATKEREYDTLIVDEAHRLNQFSGLYRNQGENQIKEIIHSSQTSIFFLDEDQRVALADYGSKEEIERCASMYGVKVEYEKLNSQFRCSGSDGYLAWLDHTLQIRETANVDLSDNSYDFKVFSDPNKLFTTIQEKNEIRNSARVVAGYCWDWISKKDPQAMDIIIPKFNFAKQWNLASDGSLWIIQPESIHQIGCIHTCQGLELDYIGVIIGTDLTYLDGRIVTNPLARSKMDQSVKGSKKLLKENPEEGKAVLDKIIKNTYRTLMTRGMKGCYVYCEDENLAEYFRTRLMIGK